MNKNIRFQNINDESDPLNDHEDKITVGDKSQISSNDTSTKSIQKEVSKSSFVEKIYENYIVYILGILVIFIILLLAYHFAPTSKSLTSQIIKSSIDNNDYLYLTLDNGLKVLLVSSPNTQVAAASLQVNVGSYAEPDNIPGLAHFLEHMLFKGNVKYPSPSAFEDFLGLHGGISNAFTEVERTNFYYQISNDALEQSLDMFAEFFINPSFQTSAIESEISAVNSEYEKDLQLDDWSFFNFLTLICNPKSSFAKFTIGNIQTLQTDPEKAGIDIRDAVQKFFNTYYSANLMSLVIMGNYPLNVLQTWATKFNSINNNEVVKPNFSNIPMPFTGAYIQKIGQYIPISTTKTLNLIFQLPSTQKFALEKPLDYISNLINDKTSNTLYNNLVSEGYITNLQGSLIIDTSQFDLYTITYKLTDNGYSHLNNIIDLTFAYLDLLRKDGNQESIYKQYQQINQNDFNYVKNQEEPMDQVSRLAGNLQTYLVPYVTSGDQLFYQYDKDIIDDYLKELIPNNVNIVIGSPDFEIDPNYTTKSLLEIKSQKDDPYANLNMNTILIKSPKNKKVNLNNIRTTNQIRASDVSESDQILLDITVKDQADTKIIRSNSDLSQHSLRVLTLDSDQVNLPMQPLDTYSSLYQIYYTSEDIPSAYLNNITNIIYNDYPQLDLPPNNTYIPQSFNMLNLCQYDHISNNDDDNSNKEEKQESTSTLIDEDYFNTTCPDNYTSDYNFVPVNIINDKYSKIFYKLDRSFNTPSYVSILNFKSPYTWLNSTMEAIITLYCSMLQNSWTSDLWPIQEAGYSINLECDIEGLEFTFNGYSDTMNEVINTVMKLFKKYNGNDHNMFDIYVNQSIQDLQSKKLDALYMRALDLQTELIKSISYPTDDVIKAFQDLNLDDFVDSNSLIKTMFFLEGIVVGNILSNQTIELVDQIEKTLDYSAAPKDQVLNEEIVDLTDFSIVYREISSQNTTDNCILNYYQDGPKNYKNATLINLLNAMFDNDVYQHFRGELHLGYVATSIFQSVNNIIGISIIIQGSKADPNEMDSYIETFLLDYYNTKLTKMTNDQFNDLITSLNNTLNQKYSNLEEEGQSYMQKIKEGNYDFESRKKMIAVLGTLELADLIQYYENLFNIECKKLSIQIYSNLDDDITNGELPEKLLNVKDTYCVNKPMLIGQTDEIKTLPKYNTN